MSVSQMFVYSLDKGRLYTSPKIGEHKFYSVNLYKTKSSKEKTAGLVQYFFRPCNQ